MVITKEDSRRVNGQMGSCGIICMGCELGSGSAAGTAVKLKDHILSIGIAQWASDLPGGAEINFERLIKDLEWLSENTHCIGCEQGGGPPDCVIRNCAKERGYTVCNNCSDLESCDKFEWLGETGKQLKTMLSNSTGKTKEELLMTTKP